MLRSRIILFKSINIFLLLLILFPTRLEAIRTTKRHGKNEHFIQTNGIHFVLNDKPLYLNGFNSYWLMYMATDSSTREKVSSVFQQASMHGMNVARTWAFNDGCYRALQSSPDVYNEDTFKGLDFVVSEARKYGIHLILSLVNSLEEYGGRKQYVQWARDRGQYINDDDEFFTSNVTKIFFKNHIKAVLTRVNSISGITYKDDPTIFAWELMNEPRCESDLSGRALQNWIVEMAAYVKSVDKNYLLEVGLEGFYGESKKQHNPGYQLFGTDFISNNQIPQVDFSTIHLYPDQWLSGSNDYAQLEFVNEWIGSHIQDSKTVLNKPLLVTEFGKSLRSTSEYHVVAARDAYLEKIYDMVYKCTRAGGPCGGATFWQLMAQSMENFSDGYEVVLEQFPSTTAVITQQSRRLSRLTNFGTFFYKVLGLIFE